MANARFTATLLEGHKGAAFEVPFDPAERWDLPPERLRAGRNGHRVAGVVNGVGFQSAVVPRLRRFWLEIDDDLREEAQLEVGCCATAAIHPLKAIVQSTGNPDAALTLTSDTCLSVPDPHETMPCA